MSDVVKWLLSKFRTTEPRMVEFRTPYSSLWVSEDQADETEKMFLSWYDPNYPDATPIRLEPKQPS